MNDINTAEIATLVQLLKKLKPGFLPYDVFVQIARIVALPILEIVPLRIRNGAVEVLLISRGDDPLFPHEMHTPGTVIRATDISSKVYEPLQRILKDELANINVSDPYSVGSILHTNHRGVEQAQVFWVEVFDDPKAGTFYPVEALPENVMTSQVRFITEAARNFEQYKQSKND